VIGQLFCPVPSSAPAKKKTAYPKCAVDSESGKDLPGECKTTFPFAISSKDDAIDCTVGNTGPEDPIIPPKGSVLSLNKS